MCADGNESKVFDFFVELRKELIESQKIRSQIIGLKITFVSITIALIEGLKLSINPYILYVPAFAAIFFDLLINSYSFSIKRLGYYIRYYLEPGIQKLYKWPEKAGYNTKYNFVLWEQFLATYNTSQSLALIGNLGITLVVAIFGFVGWLKQEYNLYFYILLVAFIFCFCFDIYCYRIPRKFDKEITPREIKEEVVEQLTVLLENSIHYQEANKCLTQLKNESLVLKEKIAPLESQNKDVMIKLSKIEMQLELLLSQYEESINQDKTTTSIA